jgi:hypothetical protein
MVATFAVGVACSSFSSSDDPPGGADGAADVERESTAADADRADAPSAVDAGNLLANGDFELGCGGWLAKSASLAEDTEFHSGSRSCRVCGTASGSVFELYQLVTRSIAPGQRYVADAYVRAPTGDAGTSSSLTATLRIIDPSGAAAVLQKSTSNGPTPSASWQRISTLIDVNVDGGAKIELAFDTTLSEGCFLIDDARLFIQ